jgi:hypothetical protein
MLLVMLVILQDTAQAMLGLETAQSMFALQHAATCACQRRKGRQDSSQRLGKGEDELHGSIKGRC